MDIFCTIFFRIHDSFISLAGNASCSCTIHFGHAGILSKLVYRNVFFKNMRKKDLSFNHQFDLAHFGFTVDFAWLEVMSKSVIDADLWHQEKSDELSLFQSFSIIIADLIVECANFYTKWFCNAFSKIDIWLCKVSTVWFEWSVVVNCIILHVQFILHSIVLSSHKSIHKYIIILVMTRLEDVQ